MRQRFVQLVMRRLLRLLAARTAQELVVTDVARDAELDRVTGPHPLPLGDRIWAVPVTALSRDD